MLSRRPAVLALAVTFAPALRAQQSADSLLAADRALSALGVVDAVGRAAPDLVLVYPGAPVIAGRDAARALVQAQPALRTLVVRWVPLYGEVSRDGSFGVTYGVTGIVDPAATPAAIRFGKYLSAWRREPDGWKLVAFAPVGLVGAAAYVAPPGLNAGTPTIARGPAADMAAADAEFAAMAGRVGAPAAFAAFIAPDGVMFAGTGELARGPDGARAQLDGNTASWVWAPVAGGAAATGDVGFTVGEATITPPGGAPFYSHYLSLWRRQQDGAIRFIADGGSARPAPAR